MQASFGMHDAACENDSVAAAARCPRLRYIQNELWHSMTGEEVKSAGWPCVDSTGCKPSFDAVQSTMSHATAQENVGQMVSGEQRNNCHRASGFEL